MTVTLYGEWDFTDIIVLTNWRWGDYLDDLGVPEVIPIVFTKRTQKSVRGEGQ